MTYRGFSASLFRRAGFVVCLCCIVLPTVGQTDVPNAPLAQSGDATVQQTSRILGIIPNFRAVSTSEHLPPQTVHEKFVTATEDSFDYSALFLPTVIAAANLARKATPEFGMGAAGYVMGAIGGIRRWIRRVRTTWWSSLPRRLRIRIRGTTR
jgi:hypothetical protein